MKIDLHLDITNDSGVCQSFALGTTVMNATPSIAALGLSLADGKAFLAQLQTQVVAAQIAAINARRKACPECKSPRRMKDYHQVNFRSLFGNVRVRVPRFEPLICQCHSTADAMHKRQRWISAELEFVQSQLAATLPYARTARILSLLMPVAAWLLENADPDLAWTNWQGRTALDVALERGDEATAALLRSYGAETSGS